MVRTRTCCHFGISLSRPLIARVDAIRGDIPRSKIIQRALESMIETFGKNSAMQSPQVGRHVETAADIIASTPTKELTEQ